MSVANELTSEVTAFVLNNEAAGDSQDLKRMLLSFHSTLRSLEEDTRRRHRAKFFSASISPLNQNVNPVFNQPYPRR